MALLDHLGEYADKLDKKSVMDKMWPHLVSQTACYGYSILKFFFCSFPPIFDSKRVLPILLP